MEDGRAMMNILYEDNHVIVLEKPINIPVQADDSNDKDMLTIVKEYVKQKYHKRGNVYIGLIHRLDRPVGGIMVFARTSKAAQRLSKQVRERTFEKTYYAVVCGKLSKEKDTWIDYLKKDTKTNTSYIDKEGKQAILNYTVLKNKNNLSLVKIKLETGRSHQIRVQFSSRRHPLYGDQRYNKEAKVGEQISLFAGKVSFLHPVTKEKMTFSLPLPNRKPYSLFLE